MSQLRLFEASETLLPQLHYTHGVPKTDEQVGERISLAFRVKRERTTPADGSAGGFYR
jgi:hypothetical protein